MASVFVLLEAFNRKEAAALGFFPCATASLEEPLLPFFKKQREIPAVSTEICYNKKKTLPVSGGGRGIQCQQF